jgi:histidine triad (HIT) family protein
MDCLFCRIINRQADGRIVLENETLVAFEDKYPQAPTHVLIVPRKHISTLNDASDADRDLLGNLILTAADLARQRGISSSGYRLILNTNRGAGQSVFHVHLHLLGGRSMHWPPG